MAICSRLQFSQDCCLFECSKWRCVWFLQIFCFIITVYLCVILCKQNFNEMKVSPSWMHSAIFSWNSLKNVWFLHFKMSSSFDISNTASTFWGTRSRIFKKITVDHSNRKLILTFIVKTSLYWKTIVYTWKVLSLISGVFSFLKPLSLPSRFYVNVVYKTLPLIYRIKQ